MNQRMFYGLGAMVAGALTLAAVANGPYYAFPAWAQKLVCATTSNCSRFIVLADWNSEAVLDRETGLVWHKSPSALPATTWIDANSRCLDSVAGTRAGWRLPTINELVSLFDPAFVTVPTLPPGHPFSVPLPNARFWTATVSAPFPANRLTAGYGVDNGLPFISLQGNAATNELRHVWCVRGGLYPGPQ